MRVPHYLTALLAILTVSAYGNDLSSVDNGLSGFVVGPYLLDVTTNSATVAFHLDKVLPASVKILLDGQLNEFKSQGGSNSHFIRIDGLESGRVYDYEVICGEGEIRTPENDDSFQIRTACRAGESFTFAVYGDPRPGDTETTRYHREVIEQVILHEPAFCLVLGDMVDDGTKAELWEQFFQIESELLRSSAIYPVMGDNDYVGGRGEAVKYFPKLQRGYYKFEWGGIWFFGLHAWDTKGEQEHEEISAQSPQIQWLESELSKEQVRKAPFRVIFLHDPVYMSRGRSSEVLRRIWAPIFQKYEVDVVFASWHLYERSHNEGITYIASGGGGAELIWMEKDPMYPSQADARSHHFCRVDISSNAMTIRAIASDGTVLDTVTLTPQTHDTDMAGRIEREAKRLRKEILINEADGNPELPLYLFTSDCLYCQNLLRHDLPNLAEESGIALRVYYFDLETEGTYDIFLNASAEFGQQDAEIPAVFIGRSVLDGESEIDTMLPAEIAEFLEDPWRYREQMIVPFTQTHDTLTIREQAFDALTYGVVFGAGLIDGVNPCALTAAIFLVSYLILVGQTRKQMFYVGGLFTLAVFLAYFAIGLTFFNFVRLILRDEKIATIINSLLLLIVVTLAVLSAVDFSRCLKGGVTDIALQLPGFLKDKIKERIRGFSKNKVAMPVALFVLGAVIAVLELVFTGRQVYLPIVTMISEPRYRIKATFYLFSYNIAFTVPLVAVFLLVTLGVTSERMRIFFRRHTALMKLALAVLFTGMALMIVYNLRWL